MTLRIARLEPDADELAGVDEVEASPESVRSAISVRADRLSGEAGALLALAAVGGQDIDVALLTHATQLREEEVVDALVAAESVGLVVAGADGTGVRFAHALVQQVLYTDLPVARRGQMHRRVAEALDELAAAGDVRVLEQAHHWARARPGEPERAAASALAAGRLTLERRDPRAAAEWFQCVIDTTGDAELGTEARIGLGSALLVMGNASHRDVLLEAARSARQRGDRKALVRAALINRGFSTITTIDDERIAILEAALESVGEADSANRALLLATLASELYLSPDAAGRSEQLGDEALAIARRVGDPFTLATVLSPKQVPWTPEGHEELLGATREAVMHADRVGDPALQCRALRWRTAALLARGHVSDAGRAVRRHEQLAHRIQDATAMWISLQDLGTMALIGGRLPEAEEIAGRAFQVGVESDQPDVHAFHLNALVALRWDQGRLGELVELIAGAVSHAPQAAVLRPALALAYSEAGLRDEASRILAVDTDTAFAELPRNLTWLAAVTVYAHVAAEVADDRAARCLYDLLAPWVGAIAWNSAAFGSVDIALGRLALTLGHHDRAEAHLESAASFAVAWGAPVWHARATLERAKLAVERGLDTRAEALLETTRGDARRLGARGVEQQAERLLRRMRAARALQRTADGSALSLRARQSPVHGTTSHPWRREEADTGTISLSGSLWTFAFRGRETAVSDSRGMRYLAVLLQNAGVERHALELQAGTTGQAHETGTAGPRLDAQCKSAYRLRIEDLEDAIEEAERFDDHERASRAREEREFIGHELAAAIGLGGRVRHDGDAVERARINVTRALKRAIGRVGQGDAALAAHLTASVRTGHFCVYDPPTTERMRWQHEGVRDAREP